MIVFFCKFASLKIIIMRVLLYPLSLIYSVVLYIRHRLFDINLLRSKSFNIPIICVGNLSFGGTGKTPHTEYLIRLLSEHVKVAVLSRGYGRSTKGFVLAHEGVTYEEIGDEPLQYHTKFPDVIVAVDEDRVEGVRKLMDMEVKPEVILLDDAYQHRWIKPGYNILLTDYHNIYSKDHLTPAGNLRDIKSEARRANVIIVTKCPIVIDPYTKRNIIDSLKPKPYQKVLFSQISFDGFKPLNESAESKDLTQCRSIFMFCGIANPYPLEDYLRRKTNTLSTTIFNDHHNFTKENIDTIVEGYNNVIGKNKIAVTTEKDAMRLTNYSDHLENIPLFSIPIKVRFHEDDGEIFNKEIFDYVGVRKNS